MKFPRRSGKVAKSRADRARIPSASFFGKLGEELAEGTRGFWRTETSALSLGWLSMSNESEEKALLSCKASGGTRSANKYAQKARWANWMPKSSNLITRMTSSLLMKFGGRNFPFPAARRPLTVLTTEREYQAAGSFKKNQALRTKFT